MANRLRLVDKDLPERLSAAAPGARREVARAAALAAVDYTGLDDQRLAHLVALLRARATAETPELIAMKAVVEELDNAAFDAQDSLNEDTAAEADYNAKSAKARAATAVLASFNDDTTQAAEDAIYEAYHAVDEDFAVIRGTIDRNLE